MVELLIEEIIAGLLVVVVLLTAGQPLYRALTGTAAGCRCCGTNGCGARGDGRKSGCLTGIRTLKRKDVA